MQLQAKEVDCETLQSRLNDLVEIFRRVATLLLLLAIFGLKWLLCGNKIKIYVYGCNRIDFSLKCRSKMQYHL